MTRSEYLLDVRSRIANNIRFHRQQRGMNQAEFADFVGLAENTVFLLENVSKDYTVPMATLVSVAHALGLSVMAMLVERERPPNLHGKKGREHLNQMREQYERERHQV